MGIGTRKMEYRKMLFTKDFKQPMKKVAKAMPVGFTDHDFYEAYKKYYPYMMTEARKMCDEYKRHNISRKKKDIRISCFFLSQKSFLGKQVSGLSV